MEKDRFEVMAEAYDVAAPYAVPMYGWLQDAALSLLNCERQAEGYFVDLGCGSGRLLEKLLELYPNAQGCCVDASAAFLKVASQRLARFGARVQFVRRRFEEPWENDLKQAPTAIFSANAIHHLEATAKRELYARCAAALAPGGLLVNIDETRDPDDSVYLTDLRYWVAHVEQVAVPPAAQAAFAEFKVHFDSWKRRNLDGFGAAKQAGDDLHEQAGAQVEWFKAAGLIETAVYFKYRLWSVMAGRKPA